MKDFEQWSFYISIWLEAVLPVRYTASNWMSPQAPWHLKSPQSLSGGYLHLTLVTKWSRSRSWMTYSHPLCSMSICPPILRYSYFKIWPWKSLVKDMHVVKSQGHIWPWKFRGQGHGQSQTHRWHLRPRVQSIWLLFVSCQSEHFWLRYSKFYICPWKFKVKAMAMVKPDGHIWGLHFNRYVCFHFVAVGPFLAEI